MENVQYIVKEADGIFRQRALFTGARSTKLRLHVSYLISQHLGVDCVSGGYQDEV